jgi:hypothetical protein
VMTMTSMTRARLVAALAAAAAIVPISSASAHPGDSAIASILASGELQVSFDDRGVRGNSAMTYSLSANGTVEYFCGDTFWGVTSWGGGDWSPTVTAEKQRGHVAGTLVMSLPATDIFTACPLGLTRTHVRYTDITIAEATGNTLHADPVATGTAVTG